MRIAQVATVSAPVCKESTGSVESLVWLLTQELQKLGHDVTVFGTRDSQVPGKLDSRTCPPVRVRGLTERLASLRMGESRARGWQSRRFRYSAHPRISLGAAARMIVQIENGAHDAYRPRR